LAAFAPPDLSALKGAGTLEEEADLVLFLHRLLRDDLAKEQIADVRAGRIPLQEAVAPHLMGVAVGKHRLDGGKTGAQERVWVEHGRVSDLPDIERRTWEAHRNAIRTGGAL
jgi:replicative DNA helicase